MPPAGTNSRAKRRELTRAEIIDTSTRLFVRLGYEQTTLGGIAETVGISVPTLLTHFPTEEHLFLAREYDILATVISGGSFRPRGCVDAEWADAGGARGPMALR